MSKLHKSRYYSFLFLMLLAFFVRGGVLFVNLDSFNSDPDGYRALAWNLRHQGVYGSGGTPTAFRPPMYPAVLAAFSYLSGSDQPAVTPLDAESAPHFSLKLTPNASIALLHWILGLLTVFLTFRLMIRLGTPVRYAFLVGFLVAVDPILLQQSRLVMTETLAAFFTILLMNLIIGARRMRSRPYQRLAFYGVGIVCGLAALTRPIFLVFALLCFPVLVVCEFRRKAAWGCPAIFLAGVATLLVPWGLRNQNELGRFTVTTTHGGYTLFLANNNSLYDFQYKRGPLTGVWNPDKFKENFNKKTAEELARQNLDSGSIEAELLRDDLANSEARSVMQKRRGDFVCSIFWRFGHLWQMLPYQTDAEESPAVHWVRYGIGLFYCVEILAALGGGSALAILGLRHRAPFIQVDRFDWIWFILMILAVQLPHLFYWTNMRMRGPIMPIVAILAVLFLSRILIYYRYQRIVEKTSPTLMGQ